MVTTVFAVYRALNSDDFATRVNERLDNLRRLHPGASVWIGTMTTALWSSALQLFVTFEIETPDPPRAVPLARMDAPDWRHTCAMCCSPTVYRQPHRP